MSIKLFKKNYILDSYQTKTKPAKQNRTVARPGRAQSNVDLVQMNFMVVSMFN